jgi:hypothetical protein
MIQKAPIRFNSDRKGANRTKRAQNAFKDGARKGIIKEMAAKKKPGASKRGGKTKSDDQKLTYKRLPANLGKTDWKDLVEFEQAKGISMTTEALRQIIRLGIRAWRKGFESEKGPDSSGHSST